MFFRNRGTTVILPKQSSSVVELDLSLSVLSHPEEDVRLSIPHPGLKSGSHENRAGQKEGSDGQAQKGKERCCEKPQMG